MLDYEDQNKKMNTVGGLHEVHEAVVLSPIARGAHAHAQTWANSSALQPNCKVSHNSLPLQLAFVFKQANTFPYPAFLT